MDHIIVRRLSLCIASISFGALMAMLLMCSAVYGCKNTTEHGGQAREASTIDLNSHTLSFPIPISCTTLVIENLASYDGAFYGNGTEEEVYHTAAVMLRNTGENMVPYAHVVIHSTDYTYVFEGFMIPGGASVLIPEKYARKLSSTAVKNCFGWSTVMQDAEHYPISILESGMDELSVTNLSDFPIYNLTIYHKTYLNEWGFYMGGEAVETVVEQILPGQTVMVYPEQYAAGYSKVVYYE